MPCLDFKPMLTILSLSLQPSGKYVWQTYKEVYDCVIKVGNSIRSCGVGEVSCYSIVHLLGFWNLAV